MPTVPKEGLFSLLWDVTQGHHIRIINSLRDRSLIEFDKGEYFLHSIIRAEAICRLRSSKEWEETNRKAAEFWTNSVKTIESISDAQTAFETYYHYLNISDFNYAALTILEERENKWEDNEQLGRALYRLGLFHQVITSINLVIDQITDDLSATKLCNILGDLYWSIGKLHKALALHDKSALIASNALKKGEEYTESEIKWLRRYEILALFNKGLCKIDLWEIEEAIILFKEYQDILEEYYIKDFIYCNSGGYAEDLNSCLAYLYSCVGLNNHAARYANEVYLMLPKSQMNSTWSIGYSFLFLGLTYKNLGEIVKSFEMYQRAISYAKESNYSNPKWFVEAHPLGGRFHKLKILQMI